MTEPTAPDSLKTVCTVSEAKQRSLYLAGGYWTEWIFVIGSILLMIGLILVGFTGVGPERIICLAMIAIITFSIYIGGVAWLSSVVNTVAGVVQSLDRMF